MSARAVLPCVLGLLIAAATPAQDTTKEMDKLQGEWTMVSLEQKGNKVSDEIVKQYKLKIKGDQWIVSSGGKEATKTFKIDPSKNPKTMDLTSEGKQAVLRGIYKLEGDTLTLCRTTGDTDRPTEFKTTPEAAALVVWKRAKK